MGTESAFGSLIIEQFPVRLGWWLQGDRLVFVSVLPWTGVGRKKYRRRVQV